MPRTAVDIPVPPGMVEIVNGTAEMVRSAPRERAQQRTAEHIADMPQFAEDRRDGEVSLRQGRVLDLDG